VIKFADEATITVASGSGGDGCIAFRREKYVPMGGPAGGDGGKGGNVVFVVKHNVRTLSYLRYRQTFKAQNGLPGMGRNMHGKDGEDVVIPMPPGTIVKDAETGEVLRDFSLSRPGKVSAHSQDSAGRDGEQWLFLKGGKGGWGNSHFKTSVNQAPRFAMPGQAGEERRLRVELSLIADVGLVGFPNAGKSSLLDAFTNARPKIACYPFTTKIPNLGVLTIHERDIILADIPGIIEGAHEGVGLGIRFLKHIARTSFLVFLVDLSEENWREAYAVLLEELSAFSARLASKKRMLVATKLDLPEAMERYQEFRSLHPSEEVLGISVFSGHGLPELREAIFQQLEKTEADSRNNELSEPNIEASLEEDDQDLSGSDPFELSDEDVLR
jgi:GTP-binding protein